MSLILELESITKQEVFEFSLTSCLCFFNETCLIFKKSTASLFFINYYANFDVKNFSSKIVHINNPPCDASGILLSSNQQYVLLVGQHDVSISFLNRSLFASNEENINISKSCASCKLVDDQLFWAHDRLKIIDVNWLPWNLFYILHSDNKLRLYNAKQVGRPLAVVNLSNDLGAGCDQHINHHSSISAALNECAIAVEPSYSLSTENSITLWVLLGSGEVLLVSLSGSQFEKQTVSSPLVMLPSREDNFGQDFCAFLVLPGDPELLVLCSKSGDLYHFLPFYDKNSNSWQLHLFDQIQLELQMGLAEDEKIDRFKEEKFSNTIRLIKDSFSATRYFCIHGAGAHAITVLWHIDVQRFLQSTSTSAPSNNQNISVACSILSSAPPSRVDYLICTHFMGQQNATLPVGWAVMPGRHRGGSKFLLIMTTEKGCANFLSIELRAARSLDPMVFETQNLTVVEGQGASEENFEARIRRLLTRESSQPLLHSGSEQQITNESAVQLLTMCTERLRVEHVSRLSRVREELSRRVVMLSHRAQLLKNELVEAEQRTVDSGVLIQELLKRARDMDMRNHRLGERFEEVHKRVASQRYTSLTTAEINALNVLRSMARNISERKERFNRFKSQVKYLHEDNNNTSICSPVCAELSSQQSGRFRSTIKQDSQRLAELVTRTKNLMKIE